MTDQVEPNPEKSYLQTLARKIDVLQQATGRGG